MNSIIKNYNSLVKKFQEIEKDSTEKEIHDKRVILRKIFPILSAYKINPTKVKNGEKAFKLFGKLRDIQVQILKLESIDQTQEITEYLAFLNGLESELQDKVQKFCKKKQLVFPSIKKKSKIDKSKIYKKADKSLNKLVKRIELQPILAAQDIHKIRIGFKKFRYLVEILSYIEITDETKLEKMKLYQDKLGEIQDYEVLIKGITKFYKKRKIDEVLNIEKFEKDQNLLIKTFGEEIETFIAVCRDVICLNNDVVSLNSELISLKDDKVKLNKETENSTEDIVTIKKEIVVPKIQKVSSKKKPENSTGNFIAEDNKVIVPIVPKVSAKEKQKNLSEEEAKE